LVIGITIFIAIVLAVGGGEIYAQMAYSRWKYEFTPSSLKLERGISFMKIITITIRIFFIGICCSLYD